jgi:L-amino acid N-acyltransferase YncA
MTHFVRPAVAGDTGRIAAIYAEAVTTGTASYELEAPTRDEMVARFAVLRDASFPYLVAQSGDEIVGYAYAGPFRTRPAYRFIVEDSIYVAPSAKGRGIGSLLLQRLIDESRTLGFRQMIAVIGDGSPSSASVRLHEKLGFRHAGLLAGSGYKHGRWLDTVFMQLAMNGGTGSPPDPESLPETLLRKR